MTTFVLPLTLTHQNLGCLQTTSDFGSAISLFFLSSKKIKIVISVSIDSLYDFYEDFNIVNVKRYCFQYKLKQQLPYAC